MFARCSVTDGEKLTRLDIVELDPDGATRSAQVLEDVDDPNEAVNRLGLRVLAPWQHSYSPVTHETLREAPVGIWPRAVRPC